jgi:hypothetical protein
MNAKKAQSCVALGMTCLLVTLVAGCATAHGNAVLARGIAGEWVDLHKSAPGDTMVWLLAPSGDDGLLEVRVDDSGRHESRRHYGRWQPGTADDGAAAICFSRRPGRDSPSCVDYALDTALIDGVAVPRLRLRGYIGEHSTGDRTLLERSVAVVNAVPASNPAPGEASPAAGGGSNYHPRAVQPERPSVATHAGTVAPGYAELETGVEHDRFGDGTTALGVPTELKLGLARTTQLSVFFPASKSTDVPFGAGDISVGLKWRVVADHPQLQDVAILPSVKFATGGDRGTGTTDASLLLINSRTVGPVGLDLNVGATWRSGDGTQAPRFSSLWTASGGIPLRGPFGLALECYGYPGTSGPAGDPPIVALLMGPTVVLHSVLELDVGFITPIHGPQPHALYAGLVTNMGRFARWGSPGR